MDFSRLNPTRTIVGGVASAALILSLLFLPWYSITENDQRDSNSDNYNPDAFICGEGEFECTGWEVFPILRWLLLLAALAPPILAWILIRGHKLSWAPGELTMVAGFAAFVLIAYNGLLDRPGTGPAEIGNTLDIGYYVALLASALIAATGFTRSVESGGRKERKAPGTV
jgi:hypothetical protein